MHKVSWDWNIVIMSIEYNKSLHHLNTFGIESVCRGYAPFADSQSLNALFNQADAPVFILGGGSNILLPDELDRLVFHNQIGGMHVVEQQGDTIIIRAGGGVIWHNLVTWAVDMGLGGLENLALIPGTVGAAPIQNIGAYGIELTDRFVRLTAYHKSTGTIRIFDHAECAFGYRDSVFKQGERDQWVILDVDLRLSANPTLALDYGAIREELQLAGVDHPGIRDVYQTVVRIRQSKLPDPARIGNAGSFFKNPVIASNDFHVLKERYPDIPGYPVDERQTKVPAGWLIDRAGWKGQRRGACGVHDRQALVLVNYGGATATQIRSLADEIIADIQKRYGIRLEQEVNIL